MNFERYEESIGAPNYITKRTRYCRFKMICIRVSVCLAIVITIVSLPVVFSGTCSAMKNIRLDSNMTRDVVILKAVVKKVDLINSIITTRVQKQFTTKRLESSIDILAPETLLDVCGSKIVADKAYIFFLIPINESNTEFELSSENVYQASKLVLRKVRKIAVQLEATTAAAATTTVGTTAGNITTSMSIPLNSMTQPCDENNALTCYNGGTCQQIGDGGAHCICTTGHAGSQCELVDYSIFTFESTSTDDSFLNMNETIIALSIMFVATILIIVVGVFVYLKYRKSIEKDRTERLNAMEEGAGAVGQNTSHETVAMIDRSFPQARTSQV